MSWWIARRGVASAARLRVRVRQRLEKIAADDPEDVDVSRGRGSICSTAASPASVGRSEAPDPRPAGARASASTSGRQPTSAPPWTPEWPRIGIRPDRARPGRPRARPTLTSARIVSTPCACWVRPIDQTKCALGLSIEQARELAHAPPARRRSRPRASPSPGAATARGRRLEATGAVAHELVIDAAGLLEQRLEDAVQEREVAARVHVEPVVGELRPEQRAARDATAPSSARSPARDTG